MRSMRLDTLIMVLFGMRFMTNHHQQAEKAAIHGMIAIQGSRLRVTLPLYIKLFSRVLMQLLHLPS